MLAIPVTHLRTHERNFAFVTAPKKVILDQTMFWTLLKNLFKTETLRNVFDDSLNEFFLNLKDYKTFLIGLKLQTVNFKLSLMSQ